jgi:hypothetical protein
MAVDRETLIKRLETICNGACAGDTEAVAKVKQIRDAAEAGDERAKQALAGLRHLYWSKQEDTASWDVAEAIYRQTAKGNPRAKGLTVALIARAKSGDAAAKATWGRLKAIHGSTKPNALFPSGPGEAREEGYGMPEENLPGIAVGGYGYHGGGYGHGGGLGTPSRNVAARLVGGQSGPNLVGAESWGGPLHVHERRAPQSGPNIIGGYGVRPSGLGSPSRNAAARLVGRNTMHGEVSGIGGYAVRPSGLGSNSRSVANRLVGGPSLVGGPRRVIGGEIVGGIPVRAANGLVVGRRPVIIGGELTRAQIQDLADLMERASRARVALLISASIASRTTTTTTAGPSAIQRASAAPTTFLSRAVSTSVLNPYTSKYGAAYQEGVVAIPEPISPPPPPSWI